MYISKNPSTTVRIARTMVLMENKGMTGSAALDARDKMQLTIDT